MLQTHIYFTIKMQKKDIYMLGSIPVGPSYTTSWAQGTARGSLEAYYTRFTRQRIMFHNFNKHFNKDLTTLQSLRMQKGSRGPTRPWDERSRKDKVNKGLCHQTTPWAMESSRGLAPLKGEQSRGRKARHRHWCREGLLLVWSNGDRGQYGWCFTWRWRVWGSSSVQGAAGGTSRARGLLSVSLGMSFLPSSMQAGAQRTSWFGAPLISLWPVPFWSV